MSARFVRPRRLGPFLLLASVIVIVVLAHRDSLLGPSPASAGGATIVVDTFIDPFHPFNCYLRAAIINANNNDQSGSGNCAAGAGNDTITFHTEGTVTLTSSLPSITDPAGLTIAGPVTVRGNGAYRPFFVDSDASLTLENLRVINGFSEGSSGGGIYNDGGEVTLINSTVSGSEADLGGGGIFSMGGAVTLNDSFIRDNSAAVSGGGIYNSGGSVTLNNSFVEENDATDFGGGIYNTGTLTLTGSEVSGNVAGVDGGGIWNAGAGEVTLTASTVGGNNTVFGSGGGIYNDGGDVTAAGGTVISANTAGGDESGQGGGGIYNDGGTVTLASSTVGGDNPGDGNSAVNRSGGGIFNADGVVIVRTSAVSGNNALRVGGGIVNQGSFTLNRSVIEGNTASILGGGIYTDSGSMTLTNSTVSGNETQGLGGGIFNAADATLTNSTVTANAAGLEGGGIYNDEGFVDNGVVTLANTIVADQNFRDDCEGTAPVSGGHNLDSDGSCQLLAAGDLPNRDANIGPLADNGGPTLTHALLEVSDAIDAGNDTVCANEPVNGVDQRGALRPHGDACDIGAFELGAVIPLWGDVDCDGNVVIGDALKAARYLLGLSVSQEPGCPLPGADVTVDGADRTWGDVDCDESVAIGDALKIARWLLGLSVSQEKGCPEIGTEVFIG